MLEQLTLSGIRLQDDTTFANFYAKNNEQLLQFLQGLFSNNEFFVYLWGNQGAGCSHLLQACCHAAHDSNESAMYLPLSEFNQLTPDIFDGLDSMDLVAIDDLDVICADNNMEEALFHLFNRLRQQQKHLLIGASTPPHQIAIALPDLLSRLAWGVTFKVHALDDEGKASALRIRAAVRGMNMPEEVANFLLRHYSRSTNDLFNALDKLDVASLKLQRKLTVPFAKQVLYL